MARVIISAGHTNNEPGSIANGLREVDLTRAIARKIVPYLRSNGIITLSVPPNMNLNSRIEWINKTGYSNNFQDIAVEIHINEGGKSGFEFWREAKGGASIDLAESIMDKVVEETGLPNLGVKSEADHEFGSLTFLSKTNTISVLLECLFIDSPEDSEKLKSEKELDKVAKGIAKGILKFLNVEFKEPVQFVQQPSKPIQPAKPVTPAINKPIQQPNIPAPVQPPAQQPSWQTPKMQNNQVFTPSSPSTNSYSTPANPQLSRDERKDMIIKNYKKVLGREPKENDLNYFINIGITKDKLLARMIESQEHMDMVKAKQEYDDIKSKYEKQNMDFTRLKAEYSDKQAMLTNVTNVLHQKNQYISQLRYQLSLMSQKIQSSTNTSASSEKKSKYKPKLLDRIFHFFSNILS